MDFTPSETQILLAEMVQTLLAREHGEDAALWQKLAALGVLGVEIDASLGGSGGCFEDLAAIMPVFGDALVVAPVIPTLVMGVGLIAHCGSAAQCAALLPGVADGSHLLAVAHAESGARDLTRVVATTARRCAEGWVLDGEKCVVLGGDRAHSFIVSARSAGGVAEPHGICLFLVPRDTAGLHCRAYSLYDGSGAADLTFASMPLPPAALLGANGAGLAAIDAAYDRARAALCAEAIGVMDRLSAMTLDYMRTRVQFGQKIGSFQALQHRMVDAHIEIELARSMALFAVTSVADPDPSRRTRHIAAAKARVSAAARIVGQTCVQLHGGIALTEAYPAGRYFKRLTMIERLFGDTQASLRRFSTAPGQS